MSLPEEELYLKIKCERLRELLKWRETIPLVLRAIKEVLGEKVLVYLFGSAIEGRLTVDSDIDIAIILDKVPKRGLERARILEEIWRKLELMGVSYWYPLEIHLMTLKEKKLLEKGGAKFIELQEGTG